MVWAEVVWTDWVTGVPRVKTVGEKSQIFKKNGLFQKFEGKSIIHPKKNSYSLTFSYVQCFQRVKNCTFAPIEMDIFSLQL